MVSRVNHERLSTPCKPVKKKQMCQWQSEQDVHPECSWQDHGDVFPGFGRNRIWKDNWYVGKKTWFVGGHTNYAKTYPPHRIVLQCGSQPGMCFFCSSFYLKSILMHNLHTCYMHASLNEPPPKDWGHCQYSGWQYSKTLGWSVFLWWSCVAPPTRWAGLPLGPFGSRDSFVKIL